MAVSLLLLEYESDLGPELTPNDLRVIHKIKGIFTMMDFADAAKTDLPQAPASLTDIVEAASAEVSLAQNVFSESHNLMSLISNSAARRTAASRLVGEADKVWWCKCGHENSIDHSECAGGCGRLFENGRVEPPARVAPQLLAQSLR